MGFEDKNALEIHHTGCESIVNYVSIIFGNIVRFYRYDNVIYNCLDPNHQSELGLTVSTGRRRKSLS